MSDKNVSVWMLHSRKDLRALCKALDLILHTEGLRKEQCPGDNTLSPKRLEDIREFLRKAKPHVR